jgi:hypothetical protein
MHEFPLGAFETPELVMAVGTLGKKEITWVCCQIRACTTKLRQACKTATPAIRTSSAKHRVQNQSQRQADRDRENLKWKSNNTHPNFLLFVSTRHTELRLTLEVSHDYGWRELCASTDRDSHGRWL